MKAKALFALGKHSEAAGTIEALLKDDVAPTVGQENLAEARALLAQCQTRDGKLQDAKQTLAGLGDGPNAAQRTALARCEIAESAYAAGNYELARESFAGLVAASNPPEIRRGDFRAWAGVTSSRPNGNRRGRRSTRCCASNPTVPALPKRL